jgi:hypothetical protein
LGFIKALSSTLPKGRMSSKQLEKLKPIVKRCLEDFISDYTSDLFKRATELQLKANITEIVATDEETSDTEENVFTEEEREAFLIVKSIIREVVPVDRINYKDNKSYLAVVIDDSSRKPICKFQFGSKTKFLTYYDADKKEVKVTLLTMDDIYPHKEALLQTAQQYL